MLITSDRLHKNIAACCINVARICAALVIAVSLLVIGGWHFDNAAFKSVIPGMTAMNPGGTALAFLLSGLALWVYSLPEKARLRHFGRLCGAGILLIALCYFINNLLGTDWGPDQMLYREKLDREALILGHVNRMAPNTAFAFLLAGLALVLIDIKIRKIWLAHVFALIGLFIGMLTVIGYTYHSLALIGVEAFIPMALNTGLCFILLNCGILFVYPGRGLASLICSKGPGGVHARRLLPVLVLLPLLLGWAFGMAQHTGLLDEITAFSLFVVLNMFAMTGLALWRATALERNDQMQSLNRLELKKARDDAENANAAKSEFLANMSRELRTPMNSILGLTRLLYEDEDLSEGHRDMAGVVYRSADNLLDILNDLLDISKIEAGELRLESIPFSLEEIINNVLDTMAALSSQKGLSLACKYNTGDMPYLIGDPSRIGRIIMNLVSNAVKFTDRGGVTISVICEPASPDDVTIELRVSDTGIGIPGDKLTSIFDKFSQVDPSTTRRFGGTGLGLNITRHLVEMMGGQIIVESELGKGSVFIVSLPFKTTDLRPVIVKQTIHRDSHSFLPENERRPVETVRILLAEDHLLSQAFMKKLFKRLKISDIDIVDNGRMALEAHKKNTYDLIITDCHMPEMSGFELTKNIRNLEDGGHHVPIVAMTADAMIKTRERCLATGMDDVVTKPVNPDELELVLSRWFKIVAPEPKRKGKGKEQKPAIDLTALIAFMENENELQYYIRVFIAQSDETLEIMRANSGGGENRAWTEAAHKLKGGASMIGADRLKNLCERAQDMNAATVADRQALFAEIEQAYNEIKENLAELPPPA